MSDDAGTVESNDDPTSTETGSTDGGAPDPKPTETVEYWKARSRENEKRAKSNAAAAERLQEIEDAGKSELEKLQAQLSETASRADAAELANLRLEVAAETGLSPTLAKRLVGSDRDELLADAKALLAEAKPAAADLKQGSRGQSNETDPEVWLRRAAGRG